MFPTFEEKRSDTTLYTAIAVFNLIEKLVIIQVVLIYVHVLFVIVCNIEALIHCTLLNICLKAIYHISITIR